MKLTKASALTRAARLLQPGFKPPFIWLAMNVIIVAFEPQSFLVTLSRRFFSHLSFHFSRLKVVPSGESNPLALQFANHRTTDDRVVASCPLILLLYSNHPAGVFNSSCWCIQLILLVHSTHPAGVFNSLR